MRVCLDVSAALAQTAGIARYVRELTLALLHMPAGPEIRFFHNRQRQRMPAEWGSQTTPSVAPLGNKLWRLWLLGGLPSPRRWTQAIWDSDLFHATDITLPRLAKPSVITICDLTTLLFPQFHTRMNRWYQRLALPGMLRRADAIIAISQATKDDLIQHLRVDPERIYVTPLGVDHNRFVAQPPGAANAQVRSALGIEVPYLLAVGTLEPRKNLVTLLHAYATLSPATPPLVLAGGQGWGNPALAALIDTLGIRERVHLTGYVADELLPSLYGAAEIFVYPSFYEGFGLPVLEAMACGAPVITSNTSSLPEVAGDAALLVDPQDHEALAAVLSRLVGDEKERRTLSERGIERAQRFTWQHTAQITLDVYRSVIR